MQLFYLTSLTSHAVKIEHKLVRDRNTSLEAGKGEVGTGNFATWEVCFMKESIMHGTTTHMFF